MIVDAATGALHEPSDDRRCGFYAHLLADDGAHHEFEARPRARHAQAGRGIDERREPGVGAKVCVDLRRVRMQVEHAGDGRGERVCVTARRAFDRRDDAAFAGVLAHGERAFGAVPFDGAAVRAVFDCFDTQRRAAGEEAQ
jgi:hypothetical protein